MRKGYSLGKRIKVKGFGFHSWNLDSYERYDDLFNEALAELIKEGLELAAKEYECEAGFCASWTKNKNRKPTLIRVELPLGEDDCEGPAWEFDLAKLTEEAIWLHEYVDGKLDPDARPILTRIRKGLQGCIAQIDEALTKIEEPDHAGERGNGEVQARSTALGQQEGPSGDET